MERTGQKVTWRTDVLPPQTLRALDFFGAAEWLANSNWYLAGGTALALQVGHRSSEDLDFFTTEKTFAPSAVLQHLETSWQTDNISEGTILGAYGGVKVSFIAYPFFLPKEPKLAYVHVPVLAIRDISVMKIVALSQRGKKRDFIDLYWYANNKESIADIVQRLPTQYPSVAHDYHHILKALLYFDDADNDPMPPLHFKVDWEEVKAYFRREVPKLAKELLRI